MEMEKQLFEVADYFVFGLMLVVCILIGVYFGFFHVSKNVTDYLVGSQNMVVWPVAVSLVVSYISGISLLGIPTEIYLYGIQFLYTTLDGLVLYFIGTQIYLPVFMDLKVTSVYEYLELRFDGRSRRVGSILFLTGCLLWLPIVVYVPALGLNHATDLNLHSIILITSGVCIFYTCVGGIRAVIWTDFLQAFIMVGSIILVSVRGTMNVGGLWTVFERNYQGGRIEPPDMEFDLTKRLTFLAILFGAPFGATASGIMTQMMMQRYVALPSKKEAGRALWIFIILKTIFFLMCGYTGLLIYATYYNCDPISAKIINVKDQLLPLLVVETLSGIPGSSGLFLAGVFSASLSSLSSGLNCVAAVILEDCYKPIFKKVSDREANIIVKSTVVGLGLICIGLTYVVEKLGTVLQLSHSLSAISLGPMLGVFTLGILFPMVKAKGAFYGSLGGLIFMSIVLFGNQAAIASGSIQYPTKPVSVDGCLANGTEAILTTAQPKNDGSGVFYLFRITFIVYTAMGTLSTILFGLIVSYATGENKIKDVDPRHFSPLIRRYLQSERNNGGNVYVFNQQTQNIEAGKLQTENGSALRENMA